MVERLQPVKTTEELLSQRWQNIHDNFQHALDESSGSVYIAFQHDIDPEGWSTSFSGIVVDVGQDNGEKWVDIRLLENTRLHRDSIGGVLYVHQEALKNLPNDSKDQSREDRALWLGNALELHHEIQRIIGNEEILPVPDEVARFYMHQIGTTVASVYI